MAEVIEPPLNVVSSPGSFSLSSFRCKFNAGSTSATMTLSVDHWRGSKFDFKLLDITGAGGGGSDVNLGISSDELKEWYFNIRSAAERDALLVSWTGASDDVWSLEASFIDATTL